MGADFLISILIQFDGFVVIEVFLELKQSATESIYPILLFLLSSILGSLLYTCSSRLSVAPSISAVFFAVKKQ